MIGCSQQSKKESINCFDQLLMILPATYCRQLYPVKIADLESLDSPKGLKQTFLGERIHVQAPGKVLGASSGCSSASNP